MDRPRILITPALTEIEWRIRPLLEEWADVASFDAPGVGGEPAPERMDLQALEDRGVAELERTGWDRCLIAGDEYGTYTAIRVAHRRPDAVAGLALGHACLSFRQGGERAPINENVMSTFARMAELDYRTFVRHLTQITQDAYDEATANEYERRVPQEVSLAYSPTIYEEAGREDLAPLIRDVAAPLLLAKHDGCLAWTDEGYEDSVEAFPEATTFATKQKPSVSPEFAQALREFCGRLDWGEGSG